MSQSLKKKLFAQILRIRMVEESIAEKYAEQQMRCPVHLSIGQEAVAVGVCEALSPEDYVLSTHRAHAHYLAKDGNLKAMIAEIYGKKDGCASGKGGSMHLVDLGVNFLGSTPIVGSSLPVAVGTALASSMKNEKKISTVFFGEGATEEGVFAESINFAALKKLPVLFICENNLYSVYSPLSVRQPKERNLIEFAHAHGVKAQKGNGNNVEEVYSLTQEAINHIREGLGPVFLEFSTYRWREHCGPNYDNDIGYRTEEEFSHWKVHCPIENFRQKILQENIFSEKEFESLANNIRQEIEDAFTFAKNSPFPSLEGLSSHIYAEGKSE